MSPLLQSNNKQRLITQVSDKEFLIEGYSEYGRLRFEVEPTNPNYVEFENGPILQLGDNFLGHGNIKNILTINNGKDGYMMIKIFV